MPNQDLRVSLLQQPLVWQDPPANRARFGELIEGLNGQTDLAVLPEMFTAGFSMDTRQFSETPEGPTLAWLQDLAARTGITLTGSYAVVTDDNELPVNRMLWVRPDGSYDYYDKRHLFRMAGEHKRYRAGAKKLLVELNGWRICPLVCYDLRFPVWCRNRDDYDLLIFVANWPAARAYHWTQLLRARAIENLAGVVGVNRIGQDAKGNDYSGDSVALDAQGRPLVEPGSECGVFTAVFSAEELNQYRERFPAHLDADRFELSGQD